MNPDKRIIIDDLTARVNASPFLIVVDYTSITVPEFTNLRSALAACGAQCHVAKNNFMRTALTDAGLPDIGEHLVGQTAPVELRFLSVQHWSGRWLHDRYRTLWGSWAVLHPDFRFWFSGDIGYSKDTREIGQKHGPFDLGLVFGVTDTRRNDRSASSA